MKKDYKTTTLLMFKFKINKIEIIMLIFKPITQCLKDKQIIPLI